MRGGEADALDAGDLVDPFQQLRKRPLPFHRLTVGIDVLPQQHHFLDAAPDQRRHVPHDVVARAAHLAPAHPGDDTEAADLVAPLHDGDVGFGAVGLRKPGRILEIERIAVKGRFHRAPGRLPGLFHHLRQLVHVVGAEHQVQVRRPPQQRLPFLLGHAPAHAQDDVLLFLELTPPAERAVDLLLGLVPHAAGVQDDQVGVVHAVRGLIVRGPHELHDPRGVELVHLAAPGLHVEFHGFFGSAERCIYRTWRPAAT